MRWCAILIAVGFVLPAVWADESAKANSLTAKEIADIEKAERVTTTEVFRLFYTPAANAVTMIKPVLSTDAQVAVSTPATAGISTGAKDVGGSSHATEDVMVVTDYPENLEKVASDIRFQHR